MLIWILRRMDLPESRIRNLVEKLTRVKIVASSVFYTLMVFIVIFGISGDVYAGFPRIVPYIIIAVFLFMAFIRIYQCMVDDSYIRQVAAKRVDDSEKKSRERAEKAARKQSPSPAKQGDSAEKTAEGEASETPEQDTDSSDKTDVPE